MKPICRLILILLLFAQPALAAVETEKCGNGIDDPLQSGGSANGTKGSCPAGYMDAVIGNGCDKKCPGVDADNDGYTSDGTLGTAGTTYVDCDDNDRRVIPGEYVPNSWSSPTGYKLCQTSGSYGSTTLNATTPLCESPNGSAHCWHIDCDSGNNANSGTFASPFKTIGKVNGGSTATGLPSSPITLTGDDYVYVRGTCNSTITTSGIAVVGDFTQAGTSGHYIVIKAEPGFTASIENASGMGLWVKATSGFIRFDNISGTSDAGGGGSGSTILNEADYVKIRWPYIHDFQGNGDNNNSAIYCSHTNGCQIEYPYLSNFQVDTGNVQGVNAVKWLDNYNSSEGNDHWFRWGTVFNPTYSTSLRGSCLRQKHGTRAIDVANKHWVQYSSFSNCSDAVWWNGSSLRFDNNLVGYNGSTGNATNNIRFFDDGPDTYAHADEEITNNTFDGNANAFDWVPKYAGTEHVKFYRNVFVDHRASYTDGNLNGMISIDGYGSDAQYTTFLASYLLSDENCYYNSSVAANFSFFRITSGGGGHGPAGNNGGNYTFGQWQSSPRSYDANSCEENVALDGNNQPTSTHCPNTRGRQYTQSGGGTTTTTTTTTTSASTTSTTSTTSTIPGNFRGRYRGEKHA